MAKKANSQRGKAKAGKSPATDVAALRIISASNPDAKRSTYSRYNDAQEMLGKSKGWADICAKRQATFIAAQPLRFYSKVGIPGAGKSRRLDRKSASKRFTKSIVGGKTALWAEQADFDVDEVTVAPILSFIHKPNTDPT